MTTATALPWDAKRTPETRQVEELLGQHFERANAYRYNSASNPSQWAGLFKTMIAGNLAILDGLDQNCGNQLLAAGPPAAVGRYDALAGVHT